MAITIPDPVIRVSSWTQYPRDSTTYQCKYTVEILVGEVVVMTRKYTDDDNVYSSNHWADSEEHAVEKALEEFGEKIRNLIGEQ